MYPTYDQAHTAAQKLADRTQRRARVYANPEARTFDVLQPAEVDAPGIEDLCVCAVEPRPLATVCLPCFAAAIVFAAIGGAFAS